MMEATPYIRLFLFIVISTMMAIVSYVAAAVYGYYVPIVVVSDETNHALLADTERIYTLEEVEESAKEMEEIIRLDREEDSKKPPKEILQMIKRHAIYVSWIPWFLVPFFLRIHHWRWGLVLLLVPALLVPTGLFLSIEILIFGSCLYLGNQFKRRILAKP